MYVSVYFPEREEQQFKDAVAQSDESRNKFIRQAVEQQIEADQPDADAGTAEA